MRWILAGTLFCMLVPTALILFGALRIRFRFSLCSHHNLHLSISWIHPRLFHAQWNIPGHSHVSYPGNRGKWSGSAEKNTRKSRRTPSRQPTTDTDQETVEGDSRPTTVTPPPEEIPPLPPEPAPEKTDKGWATGIRRTIDAAKNHPLSRLLGNRRFRRPFVRWIARSASGFKTLFHLDPMDVTISGGFADPSVTGRLFASILALDHIVHPRFCRMTMHTRFDQSDVSIAGVLGARTSLASILRLALLLFLTFPYFTAYRLWKNPAGKRSRQKPIED